MSGIVLTFPIKPGKVEAWRRFCQELSGSRLQTYEASRRRLGVTRERMSLVDTAFGAEAVTTFEAADVAGAFGQIVASDLPFDRWYRERIQELYGINLSGYEQYAQPAPPADGQEMLFEWTAASSAGN